MMPTGRIHGKTERNAIHRREFLVASGLGLAAAACGPTVLAVPPMKETPTASRATAKSTILIWLNGGPSHIDLWDMKPDAPREIRGDFQSISTSAPGINLCEHLPHLARQTHHLALVRSLGQHGRGPNDHHPGYYYNLTGHPPGESFPNSRLALPDDWPFVGSVVAHKLPAPPSLPSLVWLPTKSGENGIHRPGAIAARLGVQHDPLYVEGKHAAPLDFRSPALTLEGEVTAERLQNRHELLKTISDAERELEGRASVRDYKLHQRKALSLLTSQGSKTAFDVSREPESVRQKYGNTVNAMSMLMARRLVEAGVPFVTVYWYHDYEEDKKRGCLGGAWDTHWKNFSCLKDYLLPQFDQPFAALLDDLHARELLDSTLVVVTSEMGRTPKLGDPRSGGSGAAEPGRDHWTHCQTALLAGGGLRGGQVYGSSDKIGAYPAERPVGPEHIVHTIYHAMGIHDLEAIDNQNRPYNLLSEGKPLLELF
jgi:hypothetical protein